MSFILSVQSGKLSFYSLFPGFVLYAFMAFKVFTGVVHTFLVSTKGWCGIYSAVHKFSPGTEYMEYEVMATVHVHVATVSEPWIVMGVSEWTPAQELTLCLKSFTCT